MSKPTVPTPKPQRKPIVKGWEQGLIKIIVKYSGDRLKQGMEVVPFVDELLSSQRTQLIEEVQKQLEMTVLFNEKQHFEDAVIDWPSVIRAFIKYLPDTILETKKHG